MYVQYTYFASVSDLIIAVQYSTVQQAGSGTPAVQYESLYSTRTCYRYLLC